MKRLFIFLFFLILIACCYAEKNLFSLVGLNTYINTELIERFDDFWYLSSFNSDSNVKNISISLQRNGHNEAYQLFYNSKNLLEKKISKVYEESSELYQYDEKDRLVSCGIFTFKYLNDWERERYYRGQLQYKEILNYQNDKLIITIIPYSKRYSDGVMVEGKKEVYEYLYSNNKLTKISRIDYDIKGVEINNKNYMFLSYEGDKLVKLQEYIKDELRCEQIFQYSGCNLIQRTVSYYDNSGDNYVSEYSGFDKNNNFTVYKRVPDSLSYVRKIEYRE